MDSFLIKPATLDDVEEVTTFLEKFFYTDEPMCTALALTHLDLCLPYSNEPKRCIESGNSVKAVTSTGKIVGVCLNWIINKDAQLHRNSTKYTIISPKLIILDKYIKTVHTKLNLFQKYPTVDDVLQLRIIAVDGEWRRKRIAQALILHSRKMAIEKGVGLIMVHCTSTYTAKAVSRLGFECIYTSQYADFKKEDGCPYFTPESPHTQSSIYVVKT